MWRQMALARGRSQILSNLRRQYAVDPVRLVAGAWVRKNTGSIDAVFVKITGLGRFSEA